jgi:hypothetical protein
LDGAFRRDNVEDGVADAGCCGRVVGGGNGADASGAAGAGFTHSIVAASKVDRLGINITAKQAAAPTHNACNDLFMPEPQLMLDLSTDQRLVRFRPAGDFNRERENCR